MNAHQQHPIVHHRRNRRASIKQTRTTAPDERDDFVVGEHRNQA